MPVTYTTFPASLTTAFAETELFARSQRSVFVGTPGSLLERRNASGFAFYAHQYYDALGNKRERYVAGPVGDVEADAIAKDFQAKIIDVNHIVKLIRMLGREGFQLADSRTFAVLAALHNHGLFAGGAQLIGSHAYGAILNSLGIRAAAYLTEDVDIARPAALTFARSRRESLLEVLRTSGIDFDEVPQLDSRKASSSYKQRGRSTFQVELLAPARGEDIGLTAVPELAAHAVTLPFLGYLLAQSQTTALLAREGCCPARIPIPERFAVHKLIVSEMRGRDAKARKDRGQAVVLCAALGDQHPGALRSAVDDLPPRAVKHFHKALESVRDSLEKLHPRSWEELITR